MHSGPYRTQRVTSLDDALIAEWRRLWMNSPCTTIVVRPHSRSGRFGARALRQPVIRLDRRFRTSGSGKRSALTPVIAADSRGGGYPGTSQRRRLCFLPTPTSVNVHCTKATINSHRHLRPDFEMMANVHLLPPRPVLVAVGINIDQLVTKHARCKTLRRLECRVTTLGVDFILFEH
jgi:hypothetical protein